MLIAGAYKRDHSVKFNPNREHCYDVMNIYFAQANRNDYGDLHRSAGRLSTIVVTFESQSPRMRKAVPAVYYVCETLLGCSIQHLILTCTQMLMNMHRIFTCKILLVTLPNVYSNRISSDQCHAIGLIIFIQFIVCVCAGGYLQLRLTMISARTFSKRTNAHVPTPARLYVITWNI